MGFGVAKQSMGDRLRYPHIATICYKLRRPKPVRIWCGKAIMDAERITAYADDISRERDRGQSDAPANSLAQIDRTVDLARNRLTALEDIASAAKTLYGALTAEQKKIADSRLASLIPTPGGGAPFSTDRATRQRNPR